MLVRRGKILPIETQSGGAVEVGLGTGGEHRIVQSGAGTAMWRPAAMNLVERARRRPSMCFVLGATDAGKSTLTTFLGNVALAASLHVAVVDADVGQADLGPPGSVAATMLHGQIFELREAQGEHFGFVGATSPSGFEELLTRELLRVTREVQSERPDLLLVNTDGYVLQEGTHHKARLMAELGPELALCLEGEQDQFAGSLRRELPHVAVQSLDRPQLVSKSSAERALRRGAQYQRFLRAARPRHLSLEGLGFEFRGVEFDRPAERELAAVAPPLIARGSGTGQGLSIVPAREAGAVSRGKDVVFTRGSFEGMFVALKHAGRVEGFGVVAAVHPVRGITVNTTVRGTVDRIVLSVISLTPDLSGDARVPLEISPET